MALPWFPFNISKYVTDTMTLDTEGHGAYLLLMLHYYATEQPIPDNDRKLAGICKLPVDRWKDLRPMLEGFFVIADGVWTHDHIRDVIRDGHVMHDAKVNRTKAATEAAAAKRNATAASRTPSRPPLRTKQSVTESVASAVVEFVSESVKTTVTETQEQEQIDIGGGGTRATFADIEDSLPVNLDSPDVEIGIPIHLWSPPDGMVKPEHGDFFARWLAHHVSEGTFSPDWPAAWDRALAKAMAAPPPKRKAAPRVETNKRPEAIPGTKITPEAFALSDKIVAMLDWQHLPITVGMPMALTGWLTTWSADTIETSIAEVMAKRHQNGEGPPGSIKYFAAAISRKHLETQRPLPVAEPQGANNGRQRQANSASSAARRLSEKLAAGADGRTIDGGEVLRITNGTVSAQ